MCGFCIVFGYCGKFGLVVVYGGICLVVEMDGVLVGCILCELL